MTLDFRLDGRRALITGAGRGLGAAIAQGLQELGATVYGTSRDRASAEEIARRHGTEPVVLDVADVEQATEAVTRLQESVGGIDLLVNNAGINVVDTALDIRPQDWQAVHDTNVKGLFFVSQAVARDLVERGMRGSIVNIGSQAGAVAIEDRATYGASKGAIAQLTRNLALEWAPHGIRVNNVAPTFVRTDLTAETLAPGAWADMLLSRIPMGRFGDPEDVVGAVAFLLGDAAGLITGHTLLVDGGYTIH
jgi:NAD(P)-dependent dehydrogenase (short-subunit alcohol dehydrogenase family)